MKCSAMLAVMTMVLGMGVSIDHVVWAMSTTPLSKQEKIMINIEKYHPQLSRAALMAGVRAYRHLRAQGRDPQQVLTIVNFNKPSNEKRLWVLDMGDGRVKYHTYVAHGRNTGLKVSKYFSNQWGSDESSIGVYLTGPTYYGVDGYSMRLYGLDKGFNNHAYRRGIVMHPAWYVSAAFVKKYGRVGRTEGCFGLNEKLAPKIISAIKAGTVMVAYYPNKQWLIHSPYERPFLLG